MKTIAFGSRVVSATRNQGRGGIFRGLFVLAALGGLYYFRRRGGSVGDLVSAGRQGLDQARGMVTRFAPSTAPRTTQSVSSQATI